MKRLLAYTLVICAAALGTLAVGIFPALAQDSVQKGWLEVKVTNEYGESVDGVFSVHLDGQQVWWRNSYDTSMPGTYTVRDLKPGIYEVRYKVDGHRPVRARGISVPSGTRSALKLTVHKGEPNDVEEVGKPAVTTQPVMVITLELARLQKEIDALKK